MKKKSTSNYRKEPISLFEYLDNKQSMHKLGRNYYILKMEIIESYLKSLNFMLIGIGVGVFLILIYFGIFTIINTRSEILPWIFFYSAFIVFSITMIIITRLHNKLLKDKSKMMTELKNFEDKELL